LVEGTLGKLLKGFCPAGAAAGSLDFRRFGFPELLLADCGAVAFEPPGGHDGFDEEYRR
jgi:hypothetical protein